MVAMIRNGVFGWGDYFDPVLDSLSGSHDYYLLANDFPGYLAAQVPPALYLFTRPCHLVPRSAPQMLLCVPRHTTCVAAPLQVSGCLPAASWGQVRVQW